MWFNKQYQVHRYLRIKGAIAPRNRAARSTDPGKTRIQASGVLRRHAAVRATSIARARSKTNRSTLCGRRAASQSKAIARAYRNAPSTTAPSSNHVASLAAIEGEYAGITERRTASIATDAVRGRVIARAKTAGAMPIWTRIAIK